MTLLEKASILLNIVLVIISIPLWGWVMRIRDTIKEFPEFKDYIEQEIVKVKAEYREKLKEIETDMEKSSLSTGEIFGKINLTLVELNKAIEHLNKTVETSYHGFNSSLGEMQKDNREIRKQVWEIMTNKK